LRAYHIQQSSVTEVNDAAPTVVSSVLLSTDAEMFYYYRCC